VADFDVFRQKVAGLKKLTGTGTVKTILGTEVDFDQLIALTRRCHEADPLILGTVPRWS
jgi:hypothetical protein